MRPGTPRKSAGQALGAAAFLDGLGAAGYLCGVGVVLPADALFYAALGFMTSVITVVMNDAESRKDVGFNVWILASSGILSLFLRFWAVYADSPDQC
jgi:hypothetical protein